MFYFISDISFQADNRAIQCRWSNDSIVLAVMGTYGQFSHSTGESATHLSSTLQGGQQSGGRPTHLSSMLQGGQKSGGRLTFRVLVLQKTWVNSRCRLYGCSRYASSSSDKGRLRTSSW